jgi:hypothetical protein
MATAGLTVSGPYIAPTVHSVILTIARQRIRAAHDAKVKPALHEVGCASWAISGQFAVARRDVDTFSTVSVRTRLGSGGRGGRGDNLSYGERRGPVLWGVQRDDK